MNQRGWLLAMFAAIGLLGAIPGSAGEVVLTARDVTSATDIEAAINEATASGTQPGTVVLDGGFGEFVYLDDDRAVNIGLSDLVLRGINHARLVNCDAGVFFNENAVSNILIDGITFDCPGGDGIHSIGAGPRENVVVRNSVVKGRLFGLSVGGAIDWHVIDSIIIGLAAGVAFDSSDGVDLANNVIIGGDGIRLDGTTAYDVSGNRIETIVGTGVRLENVADDNRIVRNQICVRRGSGPGIVLGPETSDNTVRGNRVSTVDGKLPVVVDDQGINNKVVGNRRDRLC